MAHYAKYTAAASGHMLSHYDRSKENLGGNIDWERTEQNYNLGPERDMTQIEFLRQRLSEVKVQKRDDVKVFCDWVVTLPRKEIEADDYEYSEEMIEVKYSDEQTRDFFKEVYGFLEEKYGAENVISSYVHMDEEQPHMHFAFVPVVADRKWNEKHPDSPREKVSAKECVTQADLRTFHKELQWHLDERFGIDEFPVLNGATIGGNLSVAELKALRAINEITNEMLNMGYERDDARAKLQELTQELQEASGRLLKAERQISLLKGRKLVLEGEIGALEDKKKRLDDELPVLQKRINEATTIVKQLESVMKEKFNDAVTQFGTKDNLRQAIADMRQRDREERRKKQLSRLGERAKEFFGTNPIAYASFLKWESDKGLSPSIPPEKPNKRHDGPEK